MKAGVVTVIIVILVTSAAGFYFLNQSTKTPATPEIENQPEDKMVIKDSQTINSIQTIGSDNKVDKQASFAIFTNGTFRVFTASMYHNLSQDVFIEGSNPNIVKIKKEGITWNDFFQTLPFKIAKDCLTTGTGQTFCTGQNGTLKFYLNGRLEQEALDKKIEQGDKLLISFGNEADSQIQTQIEKIPDPNP